ncbi:hypothetical protein C0991_003761 [Blastosporella zonata]|nr:hypothetical protein C0991_003761 [Blastosporella zonata]
MVLHPMQKLSHFKKHWDCELQDKVVQVVQKAVSGFPCLKFVPALKDQISAPLHKKHKTVGHFLHANTSDSEDSGSEEDTLSNLTKPWLTEFQCYLDTNNVVPEGMLVVEWWGVHAHRYPT